MILEDAGNSPRIMLHGSGGRGQLAKRGIVGVGLTVGDVVGTNEGTSVGSFVGFVRWWSTL